MRALCAIALISCVVALSGCAGKPVMTTTSTQPDQVPGAALHGRVHGGNNPISGAAVYLYAVGTGGYGGAGIAASSSNASTSLLNSNVLTQTPAGGEDSSSNYYVTTDSNGIFSITGDYTCPSASSQVYLYAVGGNPGAGGVNAAAGLLAGLGPCGSLSSTTYIVVNEVSTIATAYSLAGYATDATHISSSNTSLAATDVANAFATIPSLETLSTGVALATAPISGGIVPQARINSLANILAACINSSGSGSSACTSLLGYALSGGTTGTEPTDTATVAINIAHNPVANLANLLALQSATPPFQPMLPSTPTPNDFTISIVQSGGLGSAFNVPEYPAIDASGNVWVTTGRGVGPGFGGVSKFSNIGANLLVASYIYPESAFPMGIAIDASGNVWTANLAGTITELNSGGAILAPISGITAGGLTSGYGIAIDASGNVWAGCNNGSATANQPYLPGSGKCIVELNSSGTVLSGANGFTGGGLDGPIGIAVDTLGHVWATNNANSSLSEFNSSGTPISSSNGYGGGGLLVPWGIALSTGMGVPLVWASNLGNNSWSLFSDGGTPYSPSTGYTGAGVTGPFSIAFDGAGNVWVTSTTGRLGEFNSTGSISGSSGFSDGYTSAYVGLAIDGSGNVWVVRPGGIGGTTTGSLTEYVGAAVPVVTPIVANLRAPYGSQQQNLP
jgi:hypothetical protein